MLNSLALALALSAGSALPAEPLPGFSKGIQDGWPVGNEYEIGLDEAKIATMAELGAEWVRVHFRLNVNNYSFNEKYLEAYDEVVQNVQDAGMEVLGLFTYESHAGGQIAWTQNSAEVHGGSGDNHYIRQWSQELGRLMARYPEIKAWEVWNEPNCWTENEPGDIDELPGQYYAYPSNFAWILKRAFEEAQDTPHKPWIIAGGLLCGPFEEDDMEHNLGTGFLEETFETGNRLAGWDEIRDEYGQNPYDAWAWHPYVYGGEPMTEEDFGWWLDAFASRLHELDPSQEDAPIWLTEMGWQTLDEGLSAQQHAEQLETALRAIEADGRYGPVLYFKLTDEPLASLLYGLIDAEGNRKPAFEAYKNFQF
jgi:hypothetical protein